MLAPKELMVSDLRPKVDTGSHPSVLCCAEYFGRRRTPAPIPESRYAALHPRPVQDLPQRHTGVEGRLTRRLARYVRAARPKWRRQVDADADPCDASGARRRIRPP